MNQKPLTNFENMLFLIDETPLYLFKASIGRLGKARYGVPSKRCIMEGRVLPGLTMKNYVLRGRDTIEKGVGNASLTPTYSDFK